MFSDLLSVCWLTHPAMPAFLRSCPWFLLFRSPAVQQALRGRSWRNHGCLSARYPRLPIALANAIDAVENGYTIAVNQKLESMKKGGDK